MLLDCKGSKKNYTKVSYTGKKEDFIQDYCNKGEELLQQRREIDLNSAETKGGRIFKCLSEPENISGKVGRFLFFSFFF